MNEKRLQEMSKSIFRTRAVNISIALSKFNKSAWMDADLRIKALLEKWLDSISSGESMAFALYVISELVN